MIALETIKCFDSKGKIHSEDAMIEYLKNNISGENVKRIYSEREPCVRTETNPDNDCAHHINDYAPDAEVTYSYDYGIKAEEGRTARLALKEFLRGVFGK